MFVNSQDESVNMELLDMGLSKGNRFHLSPPAQLSIKEHFDSNYRCLPPTLKNTVTIVHVVIHLLHVYVYVSVCGENIFVFDVPNCLSLINFP